MLVLALLSCGPPESRTPDGGGADEVAMFRGGPGHPGVAAAGGPETIGGLLWSVPTGGAVRSSPVVAGDRVYVGSSDGRMYALDRRTGAEAWRFEAGGAVVSTPAVGGERVIFQDRAGVILGLDRATGREVWRFETGPELPLPWGNEGWDYYVSSPTIVGDTVVVGAGDGSLYALDTATGRRLWRYATEGRIRSSPAVAGRVVFVGSADGSVHAVDLTTGEARWRHDTEGRSLDSSEFGFDRRTVQSSPAVAGGAVFVGARDGHLYAIDRETGALRWRFDHEVSWVVGSPAVHEGVVYVGSSDGLFVHAVDAATGDERWRTATEGNVFASPTVVGGTLYVGDFSGTVLGLDLRTGEERWRFRTDAPVLSSAAASDGALYVGSDDGRVYAFHGAGGSAALERAVFWDAALAPRSLYEGHEALRDALVEGGYRLLDSASLAPFMARHLASASPSVVVFAIDYVPRSVAPDAADTVLLRRYVEGGGRVVWVGYPPLSVLRDPATGDPGGLDLARTTALLGVDHGAATFDGYTARATDRGRGWGLPDWWIDRLGVPPGEVTTVLAADERGRAVAWLRSYAGPPGSGFLRLWARRDPLPDPAWVRRVAEGGWR